MSTSAAGTSKDFSEGPVWKLIVSQALPLTLAQLVHLLYNVVDRIYIGHMSESHSLALTGVGLCFPVITLIMAFAALFGLGGVPLFSIARGAGEEEKAGRIMGNSFSLLLISGIVLTLLCYVISKPLLFAFGAGVQSYVYAKQYLDIYLIGTVFSMLSTGLNGYINAQGFAKTGMMTVMLGALVNIILDPLFIFVFDMGVAGAALATVISQALSALWVLKFLFGKKIAIALRRDNLRLKGDVVAAISKLGTASFIMQGTNCAVQVACNSMLQSYGGDIYVGVMTVLNSVREVFMLPVSGLVSGGQPVISFNYGAGKYDRVKQGISFNTLAGAVFTMLAWAVMFMFPGFWFGIFSSDAQLVQTGTQMLRIYFFGFVFMALQFAGQSTFQALGDARHAIFFSLLRKAFIVVPLTLILPGLGFGVKGVFLAEPISNAIGGIACYTTMRLTVYRKLDKT